MARTLIAAALCAVVFSPATVRASGHGPVFGGATPTLGKGGWQFDQAWMGRAAGDEREQMLRSMISFGITERLQISGSAPVPLVVGSQPPVGRMTSSMSDAPSVEGSLGWRFHTRPAGHGARLESTLYVGGALPVVARRAGIESGPAGSAAIATGYASRVHYFWAGAGYEKRAARDGDRWGDVAYYSVVYGYRPPALRLEYPKPDLRFFVEAQGESNGRAWARGVADANTGGRILLVGPTTLLLFKQYGLEGGVLFPVYQRPNGVQPREHYRVVINASYFFWLHWLGGFMRKVSAALLALLLLAPAVASAELRHVQLNVLGMDWEICAHTVRVALLKLPGVESAVVSLEKAEADIRLKPDNRLTLPQLREVLKKNGYPTRDAQIEARGQLVESSGTRVFDLLNGSTLDVETGGAAVPSDRAVDVTGVTRAEGRARERLRVLSVR